MEKSLSDAWYARRGRIVTLGHNFLSRKKFEQRGSHKQRDTLSHSLSGEISLFDLQSDFRRHAVPVPHASLVNESCIVVFCNLLLRPKDTPKNMRE